MGCGQSKIGIYQRKSKSKKNGNKRSGEDGESEEEAEEAEDRIDTETKESTENNEGDNVSDSTTTKIKQMAQQQTGGAILAQSDISSSQLDFFKMLDEKIENGPDYEGDVEEEEKLRLANLLQEWKASCITRQQNNHLINHHENWSSPAKAKIRPDDYGSYPGRNLNTVDTQRFPTSYSSCPPNNINIHLQNSFRSVPVAYADQPRMQPQLPIRPQYMADIHSYQLPPEALNHCEESPGHPLSSNDPPNPLRTNYTQVIMRQSSMNPQLQHYPENQRLYTENIRQFPDSPRNYPDQRPYPIPRNIQTVNVLHEQRLYLQDSSNRPYTEVQRPYPDKPRQNPEPQRMVMDMSRSHLDAQRTLPDNSRMLPDNQRLYHERLLENERQYQDNTRPIEVQRPQIAFQKPPLLTQRSFQEPPRIYRDMDDEDQGYPRQERYMEQMSDGSSPRVHNPNPFKMGRSLSVDVQYVASPPPPREMIPLQGAPGPPQGSPRPMVARGLPMNMHRLAANSVVQYRKPRGAYNELA